MSQFKIEGGRPLSGEVTVSGNKNAVLPMIAAALLTEDEVCLQNVPMIRDVPADVGAQDLCTQGGGQGTDFKAFWIGRHDE